MTLEHLLSSKDFQPNLFAQPEYKDDKVSRVLDELEKSLAKILLKMDYFNN